jgi:hypothetical protein
LFKQNPADLVSFSERKLFWLTSLLATAIVCLNIILNLPLAYYLIALIPLLLGQFVMLSCRKNKIADALKTSLIILLICTGIVYPVIRFSMTAYAISDDYQRSMVTLSNELMKGGGGFFAGTPLLYDQDQAIPGLKNLIGPAIEYLSKPSAALLPIMIPSLYLEPRSDTQVIQDLKTTPVKFYVNSYRIAYLPLSIRSYLFTEFDHYWGSVYIYAPRINPDTHTFLIKFTGNYHVEVSQRGTIQLDGKTLAPNAVIKLTQGMHTSEANESYRLKYMPANSQLKLHPQYQKDSWYQMVKAIVL